MVLIEIYPFKNFKEKIKLMKMLDDVLKCKLEIFDNHIVVELSQFSEG